MEVKEEWLYLDSGPVRRWRAAAPGRRRPPETPCASSSAPAAQKSINEAASRTEAPVRTGRSRKPNPRPPRPPHLIWVKLWKSQAAESRDADYCAAKIK